MATYAAYRHIELDKVGYGKKRVCNRSSEIFNVLCTPPAEGKTNGNGTPRRSSTHNDSFTRLFGTPEVKKIAPRRASLPKQDVNHRNCVTGNGVESWDSKPNKLNTPRIHKERNPVTGEKYTIISPATTPTKPMQNGFAHLNGSSTPVQNGKAPTQNGSAPAMNGNGNVENGN
ncbi:microtubule-associated protein Jupiter [Aethina tumida]|uniref:microtubule-associated protein Jupiter n=1 Tax=Aethina tumida TaxID=116153 RepID=UPI0021494F41|nr:microtubule-associated protein Jupiter [Aethina tumida]